jgi:hypothetical protein
VGTAFSGTATDANKAFLIQTGVAPNLRAIPSRAVVRKGAKGHEDIKEFMKPDRCLMIVNAHRFGAKRRVKIQGELLHTFELGR